MSGGGGDTKNIWEKGKEMSSKMQITLQAAEGVWGSPAREGVAVVGDVVWCLHPSIHPSPLPGSGWVLRKPGPLWCHPAGNRLGKGGRG